MVDIRFEWDEKKEAENVEKHGVAFSRAQYAFADPHRVIAEDIEHSEEEKRHFCFGAVDGGKARQSMSSKIKYTNEPLGEVKVISDFLPPPEQLAFREEGIKVTLALSKKSIEFFKSEAAKHHTQYQRMIRRLVDAYVENYAQPLTTRSTRTARKRAAG